MPEFEVTGPISAVIRSLSGTVTVIAEDRPTVEVEVRPTGGGEASHSAATDTRVEMNGDSLLVETPQVRGFVVRRSPSVDIQVRLPLDSRIEISTASADVQCSGRYASATIKTASGDLRIDDVAGDLSRNSASGDTRFGQVGGDLTTHSASGDIRGGDVGGSLSARSASGDVTAESVGGSVKAHTASGNIRIGRASTGSARLNSASGDVEIGIAEGTSVWLDLSTVSGSTTSDLAVSDAAPAGGSAGLTLHVRTLSGDIAVRRTAAAV